MATVAAVSETFAMRRTAASFRDHRPVGKRTAATFAGYPARVISPWRLAAPFAVGLVLTAVSCGSAPIGSVGAVLGKDAETGDVHIRELGDGRAAGKAGLREGDEILMIDGAYARDLSAAAIRDKLRGPPGTPVELTVVRGDEVLRVRILREPLSETPSGPRPKEEPIPP